ncbi:hypothetical protein QQS21_001675 [Conoideocrella luteorostrata]|uniref:Protein kinase domain-containing protein n=1 Tax=Conoideocrella luteorostrata TaxID=1105319 RepID=A0AAJ0CWG1_9HYPO|nr:hypothetical protein QQS21_001675 [Conoideocrella luteorostrata]
MLNRNKRFYAPSGAIYPGGPSYWQVIDWDQRRLVTVKMDQELESEDPAFNGLLRHIDPLLPDVYLVHLSPEGGLMSTSDDPNDDETPCAFRPPLDAAQLPDGIETISRAELEEVARIGPNVDLVVYPNSARPNDKNLGFNWYEMCLWCRLKHPNIVPFDKVVVDELEGCFVGFTSKYIPGGTLKDNTTRVFKLKWLHQLTNVIDELNLNLGVAHQDVSPRNIVIDEPTDTLMLFDFNFSARIGKYGHEEPRMISRERVHHDQEVLAVEQMDWSKHPDVCLDHSVSEFRKVLDEWCERRRKGAQVTINTQAPNFIDWPPIPDPPLTEVAIGIKMVKNMQKRYDWKRTDLMREGKTILNWQRPPQNWPETNDKAGDCQKYRSEEQSREIDGGKGPST